MTAPKPEPNELRAELGANLRVGLATGITGGVLLGLLFAAATLALNGDLLASNRDVAVLTLGLIGVYGALCSAVGVLGALGKTLVFAVDGRRLSDAKMAAFVTGTVFFLMAALYGYQWCRWHRIGGLNPESHAGLEQLPILLTIAAVATLLARLLTYAFYLLIVHFKKPERRRPGDLRKALLVLAYMGGAFGLFLLALHLNRPEAAGRPGLSQDDVRPLDAPLRILALDGLSLGDLQRLERDDRLGKLAPLLQGRSAPVEVDVAPIAPVVWTRVATGRPLEAHGIVDYRAQVVRGLSKPFTVGPNQVGLFQLFQDVFPFFRLTRPVPMRSSMRGSKGLWNIASDAGRTTSVVNWWVSWPAERVRGTIVSDNAYVRLASAADPAGIRPAGETYPGSLLPEIARFASRATDSTDATRARRTLEELGLPAEVLAADLFYARSALYLLERDEPDLWMLHLPGPDVLRRVLRRDVEDPEVRRRAFDAALDAYWSAIGPVLSPLAHATESRTVWLSLPGWPLDPEAPGGPGWISVRSPGAPSPSPGNSGPLRTSIPAVGLEEIAPTFLWLLGLPTSAEMPGPVRIDLGDPERLGEPREIASFGPLEVVDVPKIPGTVDRERLELLRSLGYIDD